MKIDLHIHTKKILDSEPASRNLPSNDFFIKKMKENNVGIAAITNHNKFYIQEYSVLKNSDFLLLPGVELDVNIDGNRRQINIIASPSDVNKFDSLVKEIDNSVKKPLPYNKLKEKFDNEDWIFYPDHKRHKNSDTWWKPNELQRLRNDLKKSVFIADVNNSSTLMVLRSHKFNALIGSDVQDWNLYNENAKNLLDTQLVIEDFETLTRILKYDTSGLNKIFSKIKKRQIKKFAMPEVKYSVDNIHLTTGVNVIFGSKRTGKTEILNAINSQLKERAIMHSSSDSPEENFSNLKKELITNSDILNKKKSEFNSLMNEFYSYKEESFKDFHLFYLSLGENKTKIIFNKKWKTRELNPEIKFKSKILKMNKVIENLKIAFNDMQELDLDKNDLLEWKLITSKIINSIWEKRVAIFKSYWISELNKNVAKKVSTISRKFNGTVSKPSKIGLFERFEEKLQFIKNLDKITSFPKEHSIILKNFDLPNRNNVIANQFVNFVEFGEKDNKKWHAATKMKIKTAFKAVNSKIIQINYESNFEEIVSKVKEIFIKDTKFFIEEVRMRDDKNFEEFSNGEKAHLSLFHKLKKDRDYYLLDEPDVYLGSKSISENLLEKISDLVLENKTIVIVTHNSSLGINTIPTNYIFRKYIEGNDECSTFKGSIWSKKFVDVKEKREENFIDEIINNFEGGEKHFNFRKGIYDSKKSQV